MRKELQHALIQESSMCHDQLQQTLQQQVCQEEHADAESTREMTQLRRLTAEQAEAMRRYEKHSQELVSQQQVLFNRKSMLTSSTLTSSCVTVLSRIRIL